MTRPLLLIGFVGSFALALLAHADAPPCRYTVANGTVYDTRTKLTWQQAIENVVFAQQSQAVSYCAALTLAGGGWRLPKISELLSITDPTRGNPNAATDPVAFPNAPFFFWSSTPVANSSTYFWFLESRAGTSSYGPPAETPNVRCVR